jgi:hypothetical protein
MIELLHENLPILLQFFHIAISILILNEFKIANKKK